MRQRDSPFVSFTIIDETKGNSLCLMRVGRVSQMTDTPTKAYNYAGPATRP